MTPVTLTEMVRDFLSPSRKLPSRLGHDCISLNSSIANRPSSISLSLDAEYWAMLKVSESNPKKFRDVDFRGLETEED
jgi:hypothetical protein